MEEQINSLIEAFGSGDTLTITVAVLFVVSVVGIGLAKLTKNTESDDKFFKKMKDVVGRIKVTKKK